MVKTRRENDLRGMKKKQLSNYIMAHTDRLLDRVISAMRNNHISSYKKTPEDKDIYIEATRSYLTASLEDMISLKMAYKELMKRYENVNKDNRKKAAEIRQLQGVNRDYDAEMYMKFTFEEEYDAPIEIPLVGCGYCGSMAGEPCKEGCTMGGLLGNE